MNISTLRHLLIAYTLAGFAAAPTLYSLGVLPARQAVTLVSTMGLMCVVAWLMPRRVRDV